MFQQTPRADGAGKGPIYKLLGILSTAIAVMVAILATPPIFERTRWPLYLYLSKAWGYSFGRLLTWVAACCEGLIVYASVKLLFTSFVIWAFAALAARRFPAG